MLIFSILWSSCRKDLNYENSTGGLSFSKDTVYLDTVFTNISSSTYTLKVYNNSSTDIQIPSISLKNNLNSNYRINVDGEAGTAFFNVPLLSKDSLYIFIETSFDISTVNETNFLYTDAIEFNHSNEKQSVQLVTLIKDAIFLYPKKNSSGISDQISIGQNENGEEVKTKGFILQDNQLNFTNEKPYVIYGYAAIPENKILEIDAGARIYFHENSGIYAQTKSSLRINGELSENQELLEKEVVFEGDRLEPNFDDIAGQWGGIIISEESINNYINHLTLKNAITGVLVNGNTSSNSDINLTIKNTQIYNSSNTNLWAKSSKIIGENLVVGNAKNIAIYLNNGGDYKFTHCTIANYWNSSFRLGQALQIDNTSENDLKAGFLNCIIDGNRSSEVFILNSSPSANFNYTFKNCILKDDENNNDYGNSNYFLNIFLNENASFVNPAKNNLKLKEDSFAIDKADADGAKSIPFDILGQNRDSEKAALGAYQFITSN